MTPASDPRRGPGPAGAAAGDGSAARVDAAPAKPPKIPESVLVVIYTPALDVLLLERADHPGFWQSVTGSRDPADASLVETCRREVFEETGFDTTRFRLTDWGLTNRYEIYPHWRHRYAPGVTHNTEHVFGLELPRPLDPVIAPREHLAWQWLPWEQAAPMCFSWSNVQAIEALPRRQAAAGRSPAADAGNGGAGSGGP